MFRRFTASLTVTAALVSAANGQLITSWSAPSTDDGNPIPNFVASWVSDTTTGQIFDLPAIPPSSALAADNSLARLYSSSGTSVSSFALDGVGNFVPLAPPISVRDPNGVQARSGQIESMGFANGVLYASATRSSLDERRRRGIPRGLHTINPLTGVATLIPEAAGLPLMNGMDYNEADGFMYGVIRIDNSIQSIVRFDLVTFTLATVAVIPVSAYGGVTGFHFDGLAVGEGKVFLTAGLNSGYGIAPIAVFNLETGTFESGLPGPTRRAENRWYNAGATYFQPSGTAIVDDGNDEPAVGIDAGALTAAETNAPADVSDMK